MSGTPGVYGTTPYGVATFGGGGGSSMAIALTPNVASANITVQVTNIVPAADSITILRTNTLTGAQSPVRGAVGRSITGSTSFTVVDYEAPLNVAVTYSVSTSAFISGVLTALLTLTSSTATINAAPMTCWLKNVNIPALNSKVLLSAVSDIKYASKRQTTYVIGRSKPLTLSDVRAGRSGTLTFSTQTLADRSSFLGLMSDPSSVNLFMQVNYLDGFEDLYFNGGDLTEKRNGALSITPVRSYDLVFDEVDYIPDTTAFTSSNAYLNLLYWNSYQHMVTQRATYATVLNAIAGSALGDSR